VAGGDLSASFDLDIPSVLTGLPFPVVSERKGATSTHKFSL
jgi:hypothetical protein